MFCSFLKGAIRSAVVLAVFALLSCSSADESSGGGGMPGMRGAGGPTAVIVAEVTAQRFVDRYTALGTARATESVDLTSRVSSTIATLHFQEGQRVERGALLVQLDNRELAADLGVAKAELSKIQTQYDRAESLIESKIVSQAELDGLNADVQRAEADLRGAQARMDDTSIRAPFSGIVGLRKVSVGDLVGPDTMITTLDDTATIRLEFAMPESYLASVVPGQDVVARSEVFPEQAFAGKVVTIDSRVDPVTRAVTVIAAVPNAGNLIRPGMFMTVGVERSRAAVMLIPEEALLPRQGRQFVFVVENDKAIEKEVTLGVRAPGVAEVRSGLAAGDLIVTEGAQKLRSGAAVSVSKAAG